MKINSNYINTISLKNSQKPVMMCFGNNKTDSYEKTKTQEGKKRSIKQIIANIRETIKNARIKESQQKENPLDKYILNPLKKYGECSHKEFFDDFEKNQNNGYFDLGKGKFFEGKRGKSLCHSPWKIHIYAENETEWQKLMDTVGAYLIDSGTEFKTIGRTHQLNEQKELQKGKTFTIYPSSNEDFAILAHDIDYIIRKNHLKTENSNIIGDRKLGKTGRIFYRFELRSKSYKDKILRIRSTSDYNTYCAAYDGNRGEGKYLADDMTEEDDIWLNFDPQNPQKVNGKMPLNLNRTNNDKIAYKPVKITGFITTGDVYHTLIKNIVYKLDDFDMIGITGINQEENDVKTNNINKTEEIIQEDLISSISYNEVEKYIKSMKNGDILLLTPNNNGEFRLSIKKQNTDNKEEAGIRIYKQNDNLYIETNLNEKVSVIKQNVFIK